MNKEVHLVFEGDAWLSKSSLTLVGVYDNFDLAVEEILDSMSDALAFSEDNTAESAKKMLEEIHQTQGFEWNYLIQTVNHNEWL